MVNLNARDTKIDYFELNKHGVGQGILKNKAVTLTR
jgi:hypothetical protein